MAVHAPLIHLDDISSSPVKNIYFARIVYPKNDKNMKFLSLARNLLYEKLGIAEYIPCNK